jgi:hypothetical protein
MCGLRERAYFLHYVNITIPVATAQASALAALRLSDQLATFLAPILRTLDQRLDRRAETALALSPRIR